MPSIDGRSNSDFSVHESNYSPIQEFYTDSNVFITGATGFFGKIIIDKLLRFAPEIDTIYIMVRPKRNKTAEQRIEDLFNNAVFDRLKSEVPNFKQKIHLIVGDCMEPKLGLNQNDIDTIISKVNIIFHIAATVKFDENINIALKINVRGTKEILEICKKCINLKSIVHVSTAYSNCNNCNIEERFYESHRDAETLVSFTENQTEKRLENMTPRILGTWPNTYAFTKALAEDVVRRNCENLPISVFRPSIVIGSYREPIPGWIDNLNGPTGVVLGVGTGLLRTILADHDRIADIVPVDLVCNAIIATAWSTAEEGPRSLENLPKVTNYVSSTRNPITWGDFFYWNMTFGQAYPNINSMWYYTLMMTPKKYLFLFYSIFLHFIPGIIVDAGLILTGRKPKMVKSYMKIHKFLEVITYFSTQEWSFQDDQVQLLWDKLHPRDRLLLPFQIEKLEWDEFFFHNIKTMRWCLMKDKEETLPLARRRMARLRLLHYSIKYCLLAIAAYFLFHFMFKLFSEVNITFNN